jgi:hypothetical protein
MGTFANARAVYGLHATGTPAGTNVSGTVTVGATQDETEFTDADIDYSFKVTATATSDVATLTLSTGAVAQTTGTPTIVDGDGNDFEGVALPTAVNGYAILIKRRLSESGDDINVVSSHNNNVDINMEDTAGNPPLLAPLYIDGTIAFTFSAADDWVEVTIIAKSS